MYFFPAFPVLNFPACFVSRCILLWEQLFLLGQKHWARDLGGSTAAGSWERRRHCSVWGWASIFQVKNLFGTIQPVSTNDNNKCATPATPSSSPVFYQTPKTVVSYSDFMKITLFIVSKIILMKCIWKKAFAAIANYVSIFSRSMQIR